MKILLYSSPTYADTNAVGAWLQAVASQSGGELVTVALHGGASADAQKLIERSPDSGLEWEIWGDTLSGLDEIIYLWQHPDYDESFVNKAHNLGVPLLYEGDSSLLER